jgi:DNA-binding MarR family transcriptional regulator
LPARIQASNTFPTKNEQLVLQRYLLFMDTLRAIRRTMPIQHAYAFLLVALEGGLGVQEYAVRAGVSQAVMTRILFALGSRSRGRQGGYGLVQQTIDTKDSRRHQTFLTAKGKALVGQIARLTRSDKQKSLRLRSPDLTSRREPSRDIAQDQWLSRLIAAGRKLEPEDVKIATQLLEKLISVRQTMKRDG